MTEASEAMDSIVRATAPHLKAVGFRKRRRSFNRATSAGLVHVVNFQMGPFEPPGTEAFPPIRQHLYGTFTVNLGVFVPGLASRLYRPAAPTWVNEYDCHLRQRLGEVSPAGRDVWWDLSAPHAGREAVQLLLDDGLAWLDRFPGPGEIVSAFDREGWVSLGLPPVGPLYVGFLLLDLGAGARGEALIADYLADEALQPGHRRHLADLLPRLGLGHLLPDDR